MHTPKVTQWGTFEAKDLEVGELVILHIDEGNTAENGDIVEGAHWLHHNNSFSTSLAIWTMETVVRFLRYFR